VNGDKAATPSWVGWLLGIVQALVFAMGALAYNEIRHMQQLRESDMAEIRNYTINQAMWRGAMDAKVNAIADDVSDIRESRRIGR
jgi:carbamate kinase